MPSSVRSRLAPAVAVPVAMLVLLAAAEIAVGVHDHHGITHLAPWIAVVVGTLVLGMAGVAYVSHAVTAPLVRLAAFAEDLADHRLAATLDAVLAGSSPDVPQLPSPPSIHGGDEIAAVARALASVGERALSLAVGQAELRHDMAEALTNLGRRNQNLVTRQLDYITSIEKGEVDPDKLDQLFKLDHLATRMRRNAESLLVLGGAESPRQWSAPVALVDVVRSATAEVEDFRRVALGRIAPVAVTGRVTSDLAHLLAELLENALSYSPPQTEVQVDGAIEDGTYVLTLTDRGIGMQSDALVEANARLGGGDVLAGSPSRYLGLYVTGQLAKRHGIGVTLATVGSGGTVATITLPSQVVPGLAPPDDVHLPSDARSADPVGPPRSAAPEAGTTHPAPAAGAHATPGGGGSKGGPRPTGRVSVPRRDDLVALLLEDDTASRGRHPRARIGATTTEPAPGPGGVDGPPTSQHPAAADERPDRPSDDDEFGSWLDSRLAQLTQRATAEQAVDPTSGRPGDSEPLGGAAAGDPGDLPRRRPGAAAEEPTTGLRRRPAEVAAHADTPPEQPAPPPTPEPSPAATTPEVPRVSSSLFRYLSAVDQREDPSSESTLR